MDKINRVKAFAMTNMLLEADLDEIESKHGYDLGRGTFDAKSDDSRFFPQFEESLRREAAEMAKHYELFYCLEKSIRQLIMDVFEDGAGDDWWEQRVPQVVRENAKKSIKRERESAVTPRSDSPIDYTTFGELGEIIKSNRDIFGSVFQDPKGVERVLSNLNSLRNPIAHCSPLAEDEILRLELSVKDWLRILS
jgi:hypothetical protein